jgi:hypothetical protein
MVQNIVKNNQSTCKNFKISHSLPWSPLRVLIASKNLHLICFSETSYTNGLMSMKSWLSTPNE